MAKVVNDDHRIARVYVSEAYRENGFIVGASSWHGGGYWIPISGHGIDSLAVNMKFTEEGGKLSLWQREVHIADPDKTRIMDVTIMHLFDGPIDDLATQIRSKIAVQLKTHIPTPLIDADNPSLDKARGIVNNLIGEVISNLKIVQGNLYTETDETLRYTNLRLMRDSAAPWKDKLAFYLDDKSAAGFAGI